MSDRRYILEYDKTFFNATFQACKEAHDENTLALLCVVKMVIKYVLQHENSFNGYFDIRSQFKSVTQSLLPIVNLLLYGANEIVTQTSLTISQLLCCNVKTHKLSESMLKYIEASSGQRNVYASLHVGSFNTW